MIEANLQRVLEKISKACAKGGRKVEEIQMVAVTKSVPIEIVEEAVRLGLKDLGESRVQEATIKSSFLQEKAPYLKWHLLGHLQSNKVRPAVKIFDFIESVDSVKLAANINQKAQELNKVQDCLMEVKLSEEPSKTGLAAEEVGKFLETCQSLSFIRIRGMMCLAPYFEDKEMSRPYFARGRKIFEKYRAQFKTLSMGMSNDFEIAIEEGSTQVRIGTALFGSRK